MKVFSAKLDKSNSECNDLSLGFHRLYYNSCLVNWFFIDVLSSNILKRLLNLGVQSFVVRELIYHSDQIS